MEQDEVLRITKEILSKENCVAEVKIKRGWSNYVQNGKIYFGIKYIEHYMKPQVVITIIEEVAHIIMGTRHFHDEEWAKMYLRLLNRYLEEYI